jgi:hypothetical protein
MKKRLLAVVAALAIMTVGASAFAAGSPNTAANTGADTASTAPATTPAGTSPVTGQ